MALRTACSEVTNQRIIDQKSFCDAGMVAALLEDGAAALRGCSDIGVSTAFLSAVWPRAGVVWTGPSSSGNVDYSHTKTYVHARGILAAIGDSQRAPPRLARHARAGSHEPRDGSPRTHAPRGEGSRGTSNAQRGPCVHNTLVDRAVVRLRVSLCISAATLEIVRAKADGLVRMMTRVAC